MKDIRLHKFLADAGVTSRRKAEYLILEGRVKVNGCIVSKLGTKIYPYEDVVCVDEKTVDLATIERIYILLNKPRGYVTTVHDPEGRKTAMDLIPSVQERIYPVGRLDYHSEGLLFLTNDGEIAQRMIHPSFEVTKVYEVKIVGCVTRTHLKQLRDGAAIGGDWIRPQNVRAIGKLPNKTWLEFRVGEGKNREIRRLCEYHGLKVDKLRRVAVGGLTIKGQGLGKYRILTRKDVLKAIATKDPYRSPKKSIKL